MTVADKDSAADDTHSFVIRLRVNEPLDPIPPALETLGKNAKPGESGRAGRVVIRVEHVNSSDLSLHHSIAGALDWLSTRMRDLVGGAEGGGGDDVNGDGERSGWTH